MMKKKITSIVLAVGCVLFLSGCATTMPLSPENAKRIHTIYINPDVKTPKEMFYMGSGAGALFGLVGAVADAVADISPRERIIELAKQNNIDIGQIARDEFAKQISANTPFKVINTPNADATMNVIVKVYGFGIPTGLSSGVKPVIDLDANMLDRQGKMVWANSDYVTVLSPGMPEHSPDLIIKNSNMLKAMWSDAAERSASSIVATMK